MNDKVERVEIVKLPDHDCKTGRRKQSRLEIHIKIDTRTKKRGWG